MRCPFPGMDPYLERAEIWPDFHDRLITFLCGQLQPKLRPRYAAITQDRLFVVESHRPIYPDVSVIETGVRKVKQQLVSSGTATLEAETLTADAPAMIVEMDEPRELAIHIIEPAAGNRLITAIELLSPENKLVGQGRNSYLRKRDEYWKCGANLIEIDLLRAGELTGRVDADRLESIRPWTYLAIVTRIFLSRQEVFPINLRNRLPRIPVPLSEEDADVTLDLQAAFTRCWDEGPYPELLHYADAPPGELPVDEIAWCRERAASYDPAAT